MPTMAIAQVVDRVGSIAGWVFEHGEVVTSSNLPQALESKRRGRGYQSNSFISHPVKRAGHVLGVLNVSDRHDGADLETAEEIAAGEVADKLALVLTRLGDRAVRLVSEARAAGLDAAIGSAGAELERARLETPFARQAADTYGTRCMQGRKGGRE